MKKTSILVVEDERAIAKALELKLTHEGYEVVTAADGEAALELLKKQSYKLMLLDLVMPKMDGFQVLEALRAQRSSVPVMVLSNLSQEDDEKKARALGAKDFFIKSNSPLADIVVRVKKLLT